MCSLFVLAGQGDVEEMFSVLCVAGQGDVEEMFSVLCMCVLCSVRFAGHGDVEDLCSVLCFQLGKVMWKQQKKLASTSSGMDFCGPIL